MALTHFSFSQRIVHDLLIQNSSVSTLGLNKEPTSNHVGKLPCFKVDLTAHHVHQLSAKYPVGAGNRWIDYKLGKDGDYDASMLTNLCKNKCEHPC